MSHKCILGHDLRIGDSVIMLRRKWKGGLEVEVRGRVIDFKENKHSWSARVDVFNVHTQESTPRWIMISKLIQLPEEIVFQ